jgi:VanZ family protein
MPAILYMGLIFFESSGPVTSLTLNSVPDYWLHSSGYAVLAMLVFVAVHQGLDFAANSAGYSLPMLITVLYGISDEFHQSFIPSRSSEVRDIIADSVGALVGILIIAGVRRISSRLRRPAAS